MAYLILDEALRHCQTKAFVTRSLEYNIAEFREALDRLPIRKSSHWRSLDDGHLEFVL
jgi:hypothetical protein